MMGTTASDCKTADTRMDRTRPPNILLILTDQHRLSALGCYGPTPCSTPNIDRLAREGVRFERVYTTCPVCSPARATIITGQYPHRHGVTANCGSIPSAVWNIPDHPRMLSRQLLGGGYQCGYTGKWHLCPESACVEWFNQRIPHHVPSTLGFEGQDFMGHGGGGLRFAAYQQYLADQGFTFALQPNSANPPEYGWPSFAVQAGPKEASVDHFLANHTIGLIDRYRVGGRPFFIWHNHWGPHEPYYPVAEFYEPYREMAIPPWPNYEVPPNLLSAHHRPVIHPGAHARRWDYWNAALRHYYAFTTQIDDQIGRLYAHLEKTGLLDNTIIIFASDHGEHIGSHGGLVNKGYSHFEEIQRVGLIVRYPERYRPRAVRPGTVRTELASLVDLYPTVLDLAGVSTIGLEPQGASLHGLLDGRAPEWRDAAFVEFYGLSGGTVMVSCRCGDWKYGWNMNGTDELYNLADDPHEILNLADEPAHRSVRREMLERIAMHMRRSLIGDVRHTQALEQLRSAP